MDRHALALSTPADEFDAADRKRLDSFRLGSVAPRTVNRRSAPILTHARSHSRKDSSVSSLPSLVSLPPHALPLSSHDTPPTSPNGHSASKRNSHHRRRSSVSTRHESAELMGVSLPSIPLSASDDNINLGDKDSIRRRALWTLEGKTDVGSFSKVAIPELGADAKPFDFPTKPSYPPGIGAGYGTGLNTLMTSKRDSVGKFAPSVSNKEQLHTLMEEEEEEEEESTILDVTVTSSPVEEIPAPVAATSVPSAPTRHRPASLNLRPLSLLSNATLQADLPTPSPSPNAASSRPGLKALALTASPSVESAKSVSNDAPQSADASWKRRSTVFVPMSATPAAPRLVPLNTTGIQAPPPAAPSTARRSSISYYPSGSSADFPIHGLPTPEMTPVTDRRYSAASTDSDGSRHSSRGSRPLSVSEQHFLFQAHQTLVQRISDLERALSARPRSRPQSSASDASSPSDAISDEMLQLVADLKAERDELKKDVDGWRSRLVDTEKQMSLLFRRVENERREAWVARERVGLMEVEKRTIEKSLQDKTVWGEEGWQKFRASEAELQIVRGERDNFRAEARKCSEYQEECGKLKALLEAETRKREELERELEGLLATPTPRAFEINKPMTATASRTMMFAKRGGLGFRSIDSVGSFTDVESNGSVDFNNKMNLKVVEEEDEDDSREESMSDCSVEDSGLAGYEDEEDIDSFAFHESSSASSLGSVAEFSAAANANTSSDAVPSLSSSRSSTSSPVPPSPPVQPVVHNRHRSLSQAWTFPQDNVNFVASNDGSEVDRFFNCLEDLDSSPPLASLESGKTLFSQALACEDDELPPFILPAGFGVEIESKTVLEVVVEEEEEEDAKDLGPNHEFVGEEVDGGIIFTFSPPPSFEDSQSQYETPDLSCDNSPTPDSSFSEEHSRSFSSVSSSSIASPSSIPRLVAKKPVFSTPVKASRLADVFQTPPPATSTPVKGASSSGGLRRSSSPSKLPQPSFIPQPRRVTPQAPAAPGRKSLGSPKQTSSILDDPVFEEPSQPPSQMNDVEIRSCPVNLVPSSSRSTSPPATPTLPTRLSKFTSLVPLPSLASWSPLSPKLISSSSNVQSGSAPASHSPYSTRLASRDMQLQKLRLRLATEDEARHRGVFERSAIRNLRDPVMHL